MSYLNKIKFLNNKKGITIVWLALGLFVLLIMFASLAVDIWYMVNTKGSLGVAADAAALAGEGAGLSGTDNSTSNLAQLSARQAAWKFACKNKAAGANVFLITSDTSGTQGQPPDPSSLSSNYCDTTATSLTADKLNGTSNNPDGDIVVGYWTLTLPPSGNTCRDNCTWAPAGSGFFCPATGSTTCSINAIKVVTRRTSDAAVANVKNGSTSGANNAVSIFFGKVFGWPTMSAKASAIAGPGPLLNTPALSLCIKSCDITGFPKLLDIQTNLTCPPVPDFGIAWTVFSSASSVSSNDIKKLVDGTRKLTAQDITNLCNTCVSTQNGTDTINYLGQFFRDTSFDIANKDIVGGVVTAWRIGIAILNYDCNVGAGDPCQGCPPSTQGRPEPYHIQRWARVTITQVCDNSDSTGLCSGKKGVVISTLACTDCSNNPAGALTSGKPQLVK